VHRGLGILVKRTDRVTAPGGRCFLSAVIPAWREAETIGAAVAAAARVADEVVVADGGSDDETAALAAGGGARVVVAPRGRGSQLAAGAEAARGTVLLFLHADARLPPEARSAIAAALADPAIAGGNFRLRFDPPTLAGRAFGLANHLRRRWLGIYYGDSAIFVRRDVYHALGGYRPLPLFEDYDLARRLERTARTTYVADVEVAASARRFARAPLRTLAGWVLLQTLYSAGVPAEWLVPGYRDAR
jgi:rSAM/selenodomain-associated transferase 2